MCNNLCIDYSMHSFLHKAEALLLSYFPPLSSHLLCPCWSSPGIVSSRWCNHNPLSVSSSSYSYSLLLISGSLTILSASETQANTGTKKETERRREEKEKSGGTPTWKTTGWRRACHAVSWGSLRPERREERRGTSTGMKKSKSTINHFHRRLIYCHGRAALRLCDAAICDCKWD